MSNSTKRLAVARSARLRWDRIEGRHVLLSPERGLALSSSATEIVQLCDGTRTREGIVRSCVERYGTDPPEKIEADVLAMLRELETRGLIVECADEEKE